MNKQFETYVLNYIQDIENKNRVVKAGFHGDWWEALPFSMQWGVYLEFFDSVGLHILCYTDLYQILDSKDILIFRAEDLIGSRQEAQQEAIKKAFTILEKQS